MSEHTKKQEKVLREFLHEAVVPLIEDVLVKKLGQAMSYAKEQYKEPKREWVGLTDDEIIDEYCKQADGKEWAISGLEDAMPFARAIEAKLKEKNHGL